MVEVTVFMPVYNSEKYVGDAIQSILNQTYNDFELLIIDDGSTDNSSRIIKSFDDARLRYVKNDVNKGLPYTRNKGLKLSKGKYIAFMDSDDISDETRLQKQVEYFKKYPSTDIVSSLKKEISKDYTLHSEKRITSTKSNKGLVSSIKTKVLEKQRRYPYTNIMLLFKCNLVNPGTMVKKSFIEKNNLQYRSEYFVAQDYSFWMDCMLAGACIKIISEELIYYRTGEDHINVTQRSLKNKRDDRKELIDNIHIRGLLGKGFSLSEENQTLFNYFFQEDKPPLNQKNLQKLKHILAELQKQNKNNKAFSVQEFNYILHVNWINQIVFEENLNKQKKVKLMLLEKWFSRKPSTLLYTILKCLYLLKI